MAKKPVPKSKLLTRKNLVIGGQLLGLGLALVSKSFRGRKAAIMKAAGGTLATAGATDGAKAAEAVETLVALAPEAATPKRRATKPRVTKQAAAKRMPKRPAASAPRKPARPAAKRKPTPKAS